MMGKVIRNLYAKYGAIWLEKQQSYGNTTFQKSKKMQKPWKRTSKRNSPGLWPTSVLDPFTCFFSCSNMPIGLLITFLQTQPTKRRQATEYFFISGLPLFVIIRTLLPTQTSEKKSPKHTNYARTIMILKWCEESSHANQSSTQIVNRLFFIVTEIEFIAIPTRPW